MRRVIFHIVPNGAQWAVRKGGAGRASRILASRAAAVKFVLNASRPMDSVLYMHGEDGRIAKRICLPIPRPKCRAT